MFIILSLLLLYLQKHVLKLKELVIDLGFLFPIIQILGDGMVSQEGQGFDQAYRDVVPSVRLYLG